MQRVVARTLKHVDPNRTRGPLHRAVCRLSTTKFGEEFSTRISWPLDPLLLRLTRGRLSTAWPMRVATLETRGARTGKRRRHATLYFHDDNRVTIVASHRGRPRHPAWFHNARKDPDVTFGGLPFRADVVEDEAERERLWDLADKVFPPYASYRQLAAVTGRVIPILQLTPR